MKITGEIVSQDGAVAQVMILRSSACGRDCETCGACAGKEHILLADNRMGMPVGSNVTVEVADRAPLGVAFAVYILPLLLCGGFCLLAGQLLHTAWLGLIPGVSIWGVLLYYMNKKRGKNKVDGTVIGPAK